MHDPSHPASVEMSSSPEESNAISMSVPPVRPRSSKAASRGKKATMPWFTKPTFVALVLVAVALTVGWGTYSVVVQQSAEPDDAELADLEDFDLESPSLGQSESTDELPPSRLGDSQSRQRPATSFVEHAPQLPSPGSANPFEPPPLSSLPSFQTARYERDSAGRSSIPAANSGAWLSGTIEVADEAPSRISLPARVSQQAEVDGPAIR